MGDENPWAALDAYLPPRLRAELEDALWAPIEAQATLEVLQRDPTFFADPGRHPAMFADHGVVHVRDVAAGLVRLVDVVDGVLLPARPPARRSLVQAWGVALTYLHDVGMVDLSRDGRRVHPQYAAHLAFAAEATPLVEQLLSPGPVRQSLEAVDDVDPFGVPLDTVVREVLSLAAAHSKSTVPWEALVDRAALVEVMRHIVFTSMAGHRRALHRRADHPAPEAPEARSGGGVDHPSPSTAYGWLTATSGPKADLADDVVDAVRALRAADVLRQRGTSLRTSGGFEVFFDARSGHAMCTVRPADGRAAYVVTYDDQRGAGEANIAMASVTPRGDLRIAFHRGSFLDRAGEQRAAGSVADAIHDIWSDVEPSFRGVLARELPEPTRTADDMVVRLERPPDAPGFAEVVREVLCALAPELADRVLVVEDVEGADPAERLRYDLGDPVEPWGPLADEVVARLAEHGSDISQMDRVSAFTEVCRATVTAGEVLVERGSPPAFVYVPLAEGLTVHPVGGYAPSALHPWVPVGTTGAIRRAGRNADVVAERDVDVLMVPGRLYVGSWLWPLSPEALARALGRSVGAAGPGR
jgi:hypothetical protein